MTRSRQEPGYDGFDRELDMSYAADGSRDAFEVDWVAGGRVLVNVKRLETSGDVPWSWQSGSRKDSGPGPIRAVVGDYDLFFRLAGAEVIPTEILASSTKTIILYGIQVEKDDVIEVVEGDTPYTGKSFRVETTRYFPQEQRSVCTANVSAT